MPGLRLAHPDPDRPPSRWSETWHEAVRQRLDAVEAHPLLAIPTPHPRGPEPCEIATALASGDALPGVVWNALPASPCPPLASEAIGWRLPVPAPAVGWPADVLEQLLACRPASQQVWLIVPSEAEGWTWWSDSRFKDTLRWGASWWFETPSTTAGWDAYGQTLSAVARRLFIQTEAEQWVWPIADILQQALEEIMRTGGLHSRTGAPWGGGCAEEWARLRRTLWMAGQTAVLKRTNSFRDKFERYISKDRHNAHLRRKAYTAIAAKMARTVHAVVNHGEPYRPFFEGVSPGGRTSL